MFAVRNTTRRNRSLCTMDDLLSTAMKIIRGSECREMEELGRQGFTARTVLDYYKSDKWNAEFGMGFGRLFGGASGGGSVLCISIVVVSVWRTIEDN